MTATASSFLAALLLLTACGKSPDERARANALHMLAHERPPVRPAPATLKVYPLSKAQVSYFTSDVPTFGDGHLVTYQAPAQPAAATPAPKRAVFVADNDSAFFFLPARHAAEFKQQFGVDGPAATPDSLAAKAE